MEEEYRKLVDQRISSAFHAVSDSAKHQSSPEQREEQEQAEDIAFARCRDKAAAYCNRTDARKMRRKKVLCKVTVCLCALFLAWGLYLGGLLEPEESQAGWISDEKKETERGSYVIGGDGNGTMEIWTAVFQSAEEIPEDYRRKLIWFGEIPEGYELEKLEVQKSRTLEKMKTTLLAEDGTEIVIQEKTDIQSQKVSILNQVDEVKQIGQNEAYFKCQDGYLYCTFFYDGKEVSIRTPENMRKETEAMVASVRTGLNMK